MKSILLSVALIAAQPFALAQGSGTPSAAAQTETPQAASAAERAVQRHHEKAVERRNARAAKRAAKAASANGQ